MTNLRRRAVVVVLLSTVVVELALIPLFYFFPENGAVQATGIVLNLPGEIAVAIFMMAGGTHLPLNGKYLDVALMVIGAAISVGTWTALAGFIFRKDRTDALTAWYEAISLRPMTIVALIAFLGTGIWFCVKMASDDDATASAIACAVAFGFLLFARSRE